MIILTVKVLDYTYKSPESMGGTITVESEMMNLFLQIVFK
jgi:hypothetical protein